MKDNQYNTEEENYEDGGEGEGQEMTLYICTNNGDVIDVSVLPDTDILAIKEYLKEKTLVDVNDCKLTYDGKELKNESTIEDCEIPDGARLEQDIVLPGGKEY